MKDFILSQLGKTTLSGFVIDKWAETAFMKKC